MRDWEKWILPVGFLALLALAVAVAFSDAFCHGQCSAWMCNSDSDCGSTCRCWFGPQGVGHCG